MTYSIYYVESPSVHNMRKLYSDKKTKMLISAWVNSSISEIDQVGKSLKKKKEGRNKNNTKKNKLFWKTTTYRAYEVWSNNNRTGR